MSDKIYRILIVDDDQDILANLSDILNGTLAMRRILRLVGRTRLEKIERLCPSHSECHYDLCLLDFKMPGIDGVELYQQILQFNPKLRAIMVTAYAGDDGVKRAVEAGTWQVLRKPVDIDLLLTTIAEAIH